MRKSAIRNPQSEIPPILPTDFYQRPTLTVARDLLGKLFVRRIGENVLSGRIVEVEAYHEAGDEASHSFRGRTERNAVMYAAGGLLYVYFIYGMHYCMNVVTEEEGTGAAVLIRAIEPMKGIDFMRSTRGGRIHGHGLTNGPAKCCQAFAISGEHNGIALDGLIAGIHDAPPPSPHEIAATPRIGISRSTQLPWRLCLNNNAWVSRK